MRILLVIRSLVIGGSERQCTELATALAARGHAVTLATLGLPLTLSAGLKASGVRHVQLGHVNRLYIPRTAWRLRRLAQSIEPDVVYSFLPVSNVLCVLALPRPLRRHLVWGVRASWMDMPEYGLFARTVMRVEALLAQLPGRIITNSQAGLIHHRRLGYPANRMICIENCIDVEKFRFSLLQRQRIRRLYDVSDDCHVVALVGRIDPVKGHQCFLRAISQMHEASGTVQFWCVGDGDPELRKRLSELADSLGIGSRLRWLGEVSNMPALYSACDVAVSASLSEGFPNAVAEALACGTPVVATDVGDSARIVGACGRIVPPGDSAALGAAITAELMTATADRDRIRADFVGRFDPERLRAAHEQALLAIANQTG